MNEFKEVDYENDDIGSVTKYRSKKGAPYFRGFVEVNRTFQEILLLPEYSDKGHSVSLKYNIFKLTLKDEEDGNAGEDQEEGNGTEPDNEGIPDS